MGFSFDEINEMTVNDYIDLMDFNAPEDEETQQQASQSDIDRFYG